MPLPSQKPLVLSQGSCKAPGFIAGCLWLSPKAPKSKNGTAGQRGQAAGTQGYVEAGKGKKWRDHIECCEPPKEASPIPEDPRAVPGRQ